MAADLLLFIPLAILTNTAFPLPFDYVLLWFAAGRALPEAWVYAGVGSGCAGLAALVDLAVIGGMGRRWRDRAATGEPVAVAGRGFYAAAFLVALLPIPYTVIRLTLLRVRPRPLAYALTVAAARLPRYVVTLLLWRSLALPRWVAGALILATLAWLVLGRRPGRHPAFTLRARDPARRS